ncbi:RNA polymerase sigma factor [Paenibacillus sp. EZ-K15]|uniref:RNA polymerase sigma factor n=1 Tax=Paenibacillus sp. EZ-K15 TaxID=2044275 RepID=UPI0023511977|nr:RNA polymerase sigma factor [Paenibacillus sp. EZ-K15]
MECISTLSRSEPLVTFTFNDNISQLLPDLRSYCMQLASGSKWDAEDIVQESLIKVHHALEQSPNRKVTKAYLYRIAQTTWINMYRKQNKKPVLQADAGEREAYHDHRFLVRESLELLASQLTALQTVLIILVDFFSYTAKEAAQLIHSTEGAWNGWPTPEDQSE